jgi:hypothetical protein
MAYMQNDYYWDGEPSILVLPGSDVPGQLSFYRWRIAPERWDTLLDHSPKDEFPGSSLTTCDPLGGHGCGYFAVAAAFGGSVQYEDRPWGYQPLADQGSRWFEYPDSAFDAFPQTLGPGATFVMGPSPFCYLTTGAPYYQDGEVWVTGDPTYYFYAIDPERGKHKKDKNRGGSQAGDVYAGSLRAQVIASNHGIEVEYQLPAAVCVRATLHDAVGRQVGVLDIGAQEPGTHQLSWNQDRGGRELASGAYFVLLDMGTEKARLKAVIR